MPLKVASVCHANLAKRLLSLALVFAVSLSLVVPLQAFAVVNSTDELKSKPFGEYDFKAELMPDVAFETGILMAEDGTVIWGRHPDMRHSIASVTKIMTAIVAIEYGNLDDMVDASTTSVRPGESSVGFKRDEKYSMRDLLGALLIRSGNDAARLIATHIAGNEEAYVRMMNSKARDLGLEGTKFVNVHGLDAPGHYSTARDVANLSRYAMQNEVFRELVGTKLFHMNIGGKQRDLSNTNLLLWKYKGAEGIKTGFTDNAGYALSASATRNGITLYGVVLGSELDLARFNECEEILDFGFARYRKQEISLANTRVGTARVSNHFNTYVPVAIGETVTIPVFDMAGKITRNLKISQPAAPIKIGDNVGVATYIQDGEILATVPLIATEDVDEAFILFRPFIWLYNQARDMF